MNVKKHLGARLSFGMLAAAFLCLLIACGEDANTEIELPPVPDENPIENSDVTFTIETEGNSESGGDGSPAAPIVVSGGDTLNVAFAAKSSYKDTDGTVFTCEPKAAIRLCMQTDTVFARDLQALTKIGETKVNAVQSGKDPVRHHTIQEFTVGAQKVKFELEHETYQYVNAASQVIDMPYILPNRAKMGGNSVSGGEGTRAARGITPVVSVRRLNPTRGITLRDTAWYEVDVRFNVEAEAKNTANAQSRTLDFAVKYVAAVENVTELPDPMSEIDYEIEGHNGVNRFGVPKDGLNLNFVQSSRYTDSYGNVFSVAPKASIGIQCSLDTLRVDDINLLNVMNAGEVEKMASGENPITHSLKQAFSSGEQEIAFNMAYESYIANDTIDMPYLKINPATLKANVTVTPIENNTRAVIVTKKLYDVCAKFSVEVETINADKAQKQTLEFVVNYVGEVTTEEIEAELVDVQYRKEMLYTPAHDGLPASVAYKVYRDRVYSNGITKTDEFVSSRWRNYNYFVNMTKTGPDGLFSSAEGMAYLDGDSIYGHYKYEILNEDNSSAISTRSIALDELKYIKLSIATENDFVTYPWDEYEPDNIYEEDLSVENFAIPSRNSATEEPITLQNGWYSKFRSSVIIVSLGYKNEYNSFL